MSFQEARSAEFVFNTIGTALFGDQFRMLPSAQKGPMLAEALTKHPVLVIWDNFENAAGLTAAMVEPHLSAADRQALVAFLDAIKGGRSKVLITSRSDEAWLPTDCRSVLELRGLDGEERDEFVATTLKELGLERHLQSPALTKLVDLLAGHPLAMRVVLPRLEKMTPDAVLDAVQKNFAGLALDPTSSDTLKQLYGPLKFATDGLPEDLRPALTLIALHEQFVDTYSLGIMAKRVDPTWDNAKVDRLVAALTHAGLVRPIHGISSQGVVLDLHPALAGYLRSAWLPTLPTGVRDTWTTAFVYFVARVADQIAPRELYEQAPTHAIFGATFRSALYEGQRLGPITPVAAIVQSLAAYAQNNRDYAAADGLYAQLVELSYASADEKGVAGAYHQRGMVAQERRDLAAAEEWYRKALEILHRLGHEHGAAGTHHQLGRVAQERRDLAAAEEWYRKALEILHRLGDEHGAASTHHQLGIVAQMRGNLATAEEWYRKSLAIEERLGDEHGAASTHHQLGTVAQARRDLAAAEISYKKSLAIEERLGDEHGAASTHHQLGIVALERGDLAAAERCYKKSLEIKERLGNELGASSTHHQLGMVAQLRGDLAAADGWYSKSLEIKRRLGDSHGAATTIAALGFLARDRKNYSGSVGNLILAAGLFQSTNSPDMVVRALGAVVRTIKEAPAPDRPALTKQAIDAGIPSALIDEINARSGSEEK